MKGEEARTSKQHDAEVSTTDRSIYLKKTTVFQYSQSESKLYEAKKTLLDNDE